MSTEIEKAAEEYLYKEYCSDTIKFEKSNEEKFDLWIIRGDIRSKGELKATKDSFKSNCDISKNLIFNTEDEKKLFEKGETEIVRVFLGDLPPTLFIENNQFINDDVEFERDHRYTLKGNRNYGGDAITNITSNAKK